MPDDELDPEIPSIDEILEVGEKARKDDPERSAAFHRRIAVTVYLAILDKDGPKKAEEFWQGQYKQVAPTDEEIAAGRQRQQERRKRQE